MNGYELSHVFYSRRSELHDIKHVHADMYFCIVELWNRFGQPKTFKLPKDIVMNYCGITRNNTYYETFSKLVEHGFIEIIKKGSNQHNQAPIIGISYSDTPRDTPLDKAAILHTGEHRYGSRDGSDNIIEQQTTNNKQKTNKKEVSTDLDFSGYEPELVEALKVWVAYRKERGGKLVIKTQQALDGQRNRLKRICGNNKILSDATVKCASESNWDGLYPIPENLKNVYLPKENQHRGNKFTP